MSKSVLVGTVLDAVGVTTGGAVATYSLVGRSPDYAEVVAIRSVKEIVKAPCQVCKGVAMIRQCPVKDQHQIAGTATGAVVGSLLGNQIGGGTDRKTATVAGTVDGGYAGNKIQEDVQERDTYTTTKTRYSTVHDSSKKVVGYDVKYMFDGKAGQTRTKRDPGSRISVDENDRPILSQGETLR